MMFSRDPTPLVLVLASRSAVPGSGPSFCRMNAERDAVRVCLGVSAGQDPLLFDGEGAYICRYVFKGYTDAASGNCKPTVMDALHAGAGVHQPVGTAASGRGSKLGGVVLAMDASMAACMNFHRSTPWRRQVS